MSNTPIAADALTALTLDDFEVMAQQRLDANAWAYLSGGAADEITLSANREAWCELSLLPRVLRKLEGTHTHVMVAGRRLAHPVMLAPVAWHRLAHPDGEAGTAMAAAAQGAGMILSMQSSVPVETVASVFRSVPDAGPLWFQLYWMPDRQHTLALAQRAEAAGCEALVLTVDAPVQGVRDRERRAGFHLPPGVTSVHLTDLLPNTDLTAASVLAAAPTWDDVLWLRERTRVPLWIKGVLHPDDAREAVRSRAIAGVIVSNHGGRTLDTAITTAEALPAVVDALQGELPLLVDGGIRRGTDVLKALALGARGVLVGRPQVFALASAGPMGVARMLRLLRDELTMALALCGCANPSELSPGHIVHR